MVPLTNLENSETVVNFLILSFTCICSFNKIYKIKDFGGSKEKGGWGDGTPFLSQTWGKISQRAGWRWRLKEEPLWPRRACMSGVDQKEAYHVGCPRSLPP